MSRLRDTAAALVARVRTQALASQLDQTDEDRRIAWASIDRYLEPLMEQVHELEGIVVALEDYDRGSPDVAKIVAAIEDHMKRSRTSPAPAGAPGFVRAGDVQLPIADPAP